MEITLRTQLQNDMNNSDILLCNECTDLDKHEDHKFTRLDSKKLINAWEQIHKSFVENTQHKKSLASIMSYLNKTLNYEFQNSNRVMKTIMESY